MVRWHQACHTGRVSQQYRLSCYWEAEHLVTPRRLMIALQDMDIQAVAKKRRELKSEQTGIQGEHVKPDPAFSS